MARTALALALFKIDAGVYPDTLAELVPGHLPEIQLDPFDGMPLRYVKTEKGYRIYSVGDNLTDDGGTFQDWEKGDIIWQIGP